VYFSLGQFLDLIAGEGEFEWRHASGASEIDDHSLWTNCDFGEEIYGPDGEIRLIVEKAPL
jgi:hypothetical protein